MHAKQIEKYAPQCVGVVMLGLALTHMPYGYYTLLKVVMFCLSLFLALMYFSKKESLWILVFGINALLYNPVISFHLGREVWSWVNGFSMLCLFGSMIQNYRSQHK